MVTDFAAPEQTFSEIFSVNKNTLINDYIKRLT
jgi:hypothetical protein